MPDTKAEERIRAVATAMTVISALSILVLAISFAFSLFLLLSGLVDELPQPGVMSKRTQVTLRLVLNIAFTGLSAFCLHAGLSMRRLRGHRRAVLAATVSCIPCLSPCLVLGIPIGIWALAVLRRPEIRDAFRD